MLQKAVCTLTNNFYHASTIHTYHGNNFTYMPIHVNGIFR